MTEQTITSAGTDLRQVPAIFKLGVNRDYWREGNVNFDLGGGASNRFTRRLEKQGVTNLVVDPFNRSEAHNFAVLDQLEFIGGADSATSSNVLNVIYDAEVLYLMVGHIWDVLRPGGTAYFTVYEGNGSGNGQATIKGWQHNQGLRWYLDLVTQHFEEHNVTLSYPVIEAVKHG